ncbi:MAG TPA: glycosyltransferase family 39 protein, partial [Thermoanaerobaculia bacterium]|nr:glycosyltransferase family 39 protein [Thermoanaerobaculia bacterium]
RPMLLFLLIGMIATAAWTARYFGHIAGVLAMAMYASLPPLLGHAGLVTTDAPVAAMMVLALLTFDWWLDAPTWKRSLLLGVVLGLGALTKYSFVVYFPVSAAVIVLARWLVPPLSRGEGQITLRPAERGEGARRADEGRAGRIGKFALSLLVAFIVIWGGYKFQYDTLQHASNYPYGIATVFVPKSMQAKALWFDSHVKVPAPLFITGLGIVTEHNRHGHPSFLLGQYRDRGWWYYFPVLFFFKTPLPFLALALIGTILIARRAREGLVLALPPIVMMLSVLGSHINIGVRHILPIYPPLCGVAAFAILVMWKNARAQIVAVALLGWLFIGVAFTHPDYMAWFNEAAGRHPERIAVDSNLDWGQDWLRFAHVVHKRHIDFVHLLFNGTILLQFHDVRGDAIEPWVEKPGWYGLSLQGLTMNDDARRGAWKWLDRYPYEMVGKGIRLYHVP